MKSIFLRVLFVALVGSAAASSATAQQAIPIRALAAPLAVSDTFFTGIALNQTRVWQWPDGHVVINHRYPGLLVVQDSMLRNARTLADTTILSFGVGAKPIIALPFSRDSTALVDPGNSSLLFIDAGGKQSRVAALPHARDAGTISANLTGGLALDQRGHLWYRATPVRPPTPVPTRGQSVIAASTDTFPLVRVDFQTRMVDTIEKMILLSGTKAVSTQLDDGTIERKVILNPSTLTDDWAVLSDGSLAVVRGHDYHIDWIYPDGSRASTPKMPFDWRRLGDDDKQALIDSLKAFNAMVDFKFDSLAKARGSTPLPRPERVYVPLVEVRDYYAPIRNGALMADLNNQLWILPTTSAQARGGLLYDVVNKKGEIVERVQLPPRTVLAGFGLNGAVFLRETLTQSSARIIRTRVVR